MEAIYFDLDATKVINVRYGESSFKKIDELWTDFKPHGGEKTTVFIPNIVKRTEKNEILVEAIRQGYAALKAETDEWEKHMYQLRNQFER